MLAPGGPYQGDPSVVSKTDVVWLLQEAARERDDERQRQKAWAQQNRTGTSNVKAETPKK